MAGRSFSLSKARCLLTLSGLLLSVGCVGHATAAPSATDPVLQALVIEAERTMAAWEGEEDAPYYLAYRVVDETTWRVGASEGALAWNDDARGVYLDIGVRVGDHQVDNTHRLRDTGRWDWSFRMPTRLPLFCGAESGQVPNSGVSPSLLLSRLEVQRKEKDQDRPPLLPKPTAPGEDS